MKLCVSICEPSSLSIFTLCPQGVSGNYHFATVSTHWKMTSAISTCQLQGQNIFTHIFSFFSHHPLKSVGLCDPPPTHTHTHLSPLLCNPRLNHYYHLPLLVHYTPFLFIFLFLSGPTSCPFSCIRLHLCLFTLSYGFGRRTDCDAALQVAVTLLH